MYSGFGEEIRNEYAGTGTGISIEELYQQARQTQQQFFTSFSEQVSPYLADEMNTAFQRMERTRSQGTGNQDHDLGSPGQESSNPGQNPYDQGPDLGNQGQGLDNQAQGPINQEMEPSSPGQGLDNQDQEPNKIEPDPSTQGQGNGNGGGNGSGRQQGK
jgi:hypothetical protein